MANVLVRLSRAIVKLPGRLLRGIGLSQKAYTEVFGPR
jgi:hypothetical protein